MDEIKAIVAIVAIVCFFTAVERFAPERPEKPVVECSK